jgi:hypothetical protein
MGLDARGSHEETIREFGLGDEDLAAWRTSGLADDAFVDWLNPRGGMAVLALPIDDKSDSTSASRVLSSPHTSLTNLRRSSGFCRKADSKICLTSCHFVSGITTFGRLVDLLPMFRRSLLLPHVLKCSGHQFSL